MNNTRAEYSKRLHEVEIYFDTLKFLDGGDCTIKRIDILGNDTNKEIDTELLTILKANGFLLLYNLVESTVRKSIEAIINSMHSSSVTFRNLSEELRKLWIRQEVKNANDEKVLSIANTVLENKLIKFKNEFINISGNIDAQEIRKILKKVGGKEVSNGRSLKAIKDKRNNLAHGEFSFSEIGRNYTVSELLAYKDETKDYLTKVLDEIQLYIDNQKFLKNNK